MNFRVHCNETSAPMNGSMEVEKPVEGRLEETGNMCSKITDWGEDSDRERSKNTTRPPEMSYS